MADILRVTTPLVPSNQSVHPVKAPQESGAIFNIQDVTRVQKTNPEAETQQQHNTLFGQDMPNIMMNLLKDPAVTVTFLRNIFLLQDIVGLLSANNQSVTEELENLFAALMVGKEDIVPEMLSQDADSTRFQGALFEMLKNLLAQNPHNNELRGEVVRFLKGLSGQMNQRDILDALSNNLRFLSDTLSSSAGLSGKLSEMSQLLRQSEAGKNFPLLRSEIQNLLREVEGSILFSPKLEKVVSITSYNLSRYQDNLAFLQESGMRLFDLIPDAAGKNSLMNAVADFIALLTLSDPSEKNILKDVGKTLTEGLQKQAFTDKIRELVDAIARGGDGKQNSKVMDALVKILQLQTEDETIKLLSSGKLEKIIESLLSSPCNFTPLLHFIVPVEFMNMRSFAEMWINPNGEEDQAAAGQEAEKSTHMLIVFDIANIGRFEAELYVKGEVIDLSLFCPPAYINEFSSVSVDLKRSVQGLPYRFGDIFVKKLERSRSLIEVFTSLPNRRAGLDVKI